MLMKAIALSLRQLADARTFRLMLLVAILTCAIFVGLGVLGWQAMLHWLVPRFSGWIGAEEAAGIALLLTLLFGWFLFRALAMAVMGMFTDNIIESVEEDHYPQVAARAVPVSFARGLAMGLRSAARAVGWNLLAAPAYLALLVTGVGTLALAVAINAVLLGRDLELMAAARHPGLPDRPLPRRQRLLLGLVAAIAFLVPVLNLFAPVFAAALAVHMLHMPKQGMPKQETV
ncbi:MAG: EI24 domain-containing protein [Pseudomonadota bacterium]